MPNSMDWGLSAPYLLAALLGGYVLGSIPFGLILTRLAGMGDIRAIGSGNIGATNVLRTGNKFLALLTLLLDGGKEIAKGQSDSRGEWVIIVQDPPLAAGQHELRVVQHIEGKAPLTSEQAVVAVVPEPPAAHAPIQPRAETLVMISPPAGAATLVQPHTAAGLPKSADLFVSTLDYDDSGYVTVSGLAAPGTVVRAYVNDRMVAEGRAASDGRWRLKPADPIGQGKHLLRLDRIATDGKPVARLELPFDRVVVAPVSSTDGRRLHIVKGDNLWNIAQAHYGAGWRHTVIFAANKDQVKNPHLIYPGQILSLPKVN